jgi:hypothetical protein
MPPLHPTDIRSWYDRFDTPVVPFDCGELCAPHNPNDKPFCCDICHAVPSAYHQEWAYLEANTDLWHPWRGDECLDHPQDPATLVGETPDSMCLLACLGPVHCQRQYRSLSCRQFPFFPYLTSGGEFIGLVYNWDFEDTCWVISHLDQVDLAYISEFIQFYDAFFAAIPASIDHYAWRSSQMMGHFITQKRSLPLLHRDGGYYLLRPLNQRLRLVDPKRLPRYGPYREVT